MRLKQNSRIHFSFIALCRLLSNRGVPTVAIVPFFRHGLPEEDTLHHRATFDPDAINVALIAYPYASNFGEFDPLIQEKGVNVAPLKEFDAIILPGSKNTAQSLRHLRASGFAEEIAHAAARGTPILGVCGGMQMLGREILDPDSLEGGDIDGLGLVDVTTTLKPYKITRRAHVRAAAGLAHFP